MVSEESQKEELPDPLSVLSRYSEQMPHWLTNYRAGLPFPRTDFFASRIAYYPGSESDGHLLRTFGKAHAAHCFVNVDYNYPSADLEAQLADEKHPLHPKGYRLLTLIRLKECDLTPRGWISTFKVGELKEAYAPLMPSKGPFALWSVLERLETYGADHGPSRMSILSVGGDGIATFDALFCQKGCTLPYAVLLHDHGFGGNWTKFGGGGKSLMETSLNKKGCATQVAACSRKY